MTWAATLSQTTFQLLAGQSATFDYTPSAVSQKFKDVIVHVYVDGHESEQVPFTNVGVVLPQDHINGKDTPDGFEDRISTLTGTGNWGTYEGVMQMYPSVYGTVAVGRVSTLSRTYGNFCNVVMMIRACSPARACASWPES